MTALAEPKIDDVADTALWIAAYRAKESARKDALFRAGDRDSLSMVDLVDEDSTLGESDLDVEVPQEACRSQGRPRRLDVRHRKPERRHSTTKRVRPPWASPTVRGTVHLTRFFIARAHALSVFR